MMKMSTKFAHRTTLDDKGALFNILQKNQEEKEIKRLMVQAGRMASASLLLVLHDESQKNQRIAFAKFCDPASSLVLRCYLLIREDYFNSLNDELVSSSIAEDIRTTFFGRNATSKIHLDEKLTELIEKDCTSGVLEIVAEDLFKQLRQCFARFLCYLVANKLAINFPTFVDCLSECGESGERFFKFCQSVQHEKTLSFCREVTNFEETSGSDFETYHEAIAIYDQYHLEPFFSAHAHEVFLELEKGKANRCLFQSVRSIAETLLLEDVWPSFLVQG